MDAGRQRSFTDLKVDILEDVLLHAAVGKCLAQFLCFNDISHKGLLFMLGGAPAVSAAFLPVFLFTPLS